MKGLRVKESFFLPAIEEGEIDQREGTFIFGDLEINAMMQYQWASCASMGAWNGGGYG
jgi:hypothetical protein